MQHLLSIEELDAATIEQLLADAARLKATRGSHETPLSGQTWAMIFTKSSTRTRVSFEVGIRELGGAPIPVINALTDDEHPCQILADLLTVQEFLGGWAGKKVAFIGDGFSNMTISWMWAAKHLGFELSVACPADYAPGATFLEKLNAPNVTITHDPVAAAKDAHVINTDVWLSMGQEDQKDKELAFGPFQVNAALLAHSAPGHIVLHCLPAYRGKEITEEVLENQASVIFQQAENRLHAQKAVLVAVSR